VGKTAIILGATGLTGSHLLSLLVNNNAYTKIIILSRKQIPFAGDKIELVLTDFSDIQSLSNKIKGDDIFCCLGTTLKKAGSIAAFIKTDYDIPYKVALEGHRNEVKAFYLVSSIGAKADSYNYYIKTKGRLEQSIKELNFDKTVILRPSFLTGNRKEFRFTETIAKFIYIPFSVFFLGPLKKYKTVQALKVAKMLVKSTQFTPGFYIIESDKINSIK
jgi:uncharacterized protein YbjT (DUF2867 family)